MKKMLSFAALALALLLTACSSDTQLFKKGSDVGNCLLPGSFVYDKENDVYTLTASGYDMWFEHDEFFMVWQEITGDFKLSARVAFEGEGVHELRKMGLIIRESLEGDARHANAALHGNALVGLQFRREKGGETEEVRSANLTRRFPTFHEETEEEAAERRANEQATTRMPDHLFLERVGNKIIMKSGIGGYFDEPCATIEIDLPAKALVGLFVCSHTVDLLETGYFYDVKLETR